MILNYTQLKSRVQMAGAMRGFEDAQVNGTSVDVRLGRTLKVEMADPDLPEDELRIVSLGQRESLTFEDFDLLVQPEEGGEPKPVPFLLYPGQFVLGHTIEEFHLPLDLSAEFRLKSSAARMGLSHALAVWCDPGWSGSTLTLELHNVSSRHVIALNYGDRIGQMVFHAHYPVPRDRSYLTRGAYNGNMSAEPARPAKN
jgi:deoxycytidine triphosphate deaminase